jgi:hypothetical protein
MCVFSRNFAKGTKKTQELLGISGAATENRSQYIPNRVQSVSPERLEYPLMDSGG